ncbi:hydrolase [Aliamphritea hakodatensis]|uniref:hydrolase n=1 Tax=Aliamphritea hakodatensis TaxID=2895352 RepID=UPI0022FD7EAF|nr:hydrolase [Aliamphritea hakodatensis]
MNHDLTQWLTWLDDEYPDMLGKTIELANINSGSLNVAGVNSVGDKLKEYAQVLGGKIETLPVSPYELLDANGVLQSLPLGDAVRISKRPEAPLQVFFCAHMDTVFAIDSDFQTVTWLDDETINGPGVSDLKGGIIVMLKAIETLERSPYADRIGWQILFNPDEEIGSPGSAALIQDAAKTAHLGMIYEPSFPDGNLAGARKGSGNFSVKATGKAAHAGREHHLGRNAIRAMCDFVSQLDDLNGQREGVTINPGFIEGGGAVNIVPDLCVFRFNIRLEQPEDEAWCLEHIQRLLTDINNRDGLELELFGGFGRKPKVLSPTNTRLFELAQECGSNLGMKIEWLPTGGCCDGNNLAAAGVPNIDTLGVQGGKIHSSDEYMKVRSLTERAKLSGLMLLKLASSEDIRWLTDAKNSCAGEH